MEALVSTKMTTPTFLHPILSKSSHSSNHRFKCFIGRHGHLLSRTISPGHLSLYCRRSRRNSVSVQAVKKKKNDNKNPNKKLDSHSFFPKPDEVTGPFPEAILLRERTVEEDGKLLPEFADAEEREMFEYLTLELESKLNVERMRHYEIVYLIHQDRIDEVDSVNSKVQDFLREKKGKVWRFNDWGLRRLAYKIKKTTHAHYILMNFELEAKWINDFKNMLEKDERVIRYLVIKRKKAITEVCPPPPEYHTLMAEMDDEYLYDDDDDDDEEEDDDDEAYVDEEEEDRDDDDDDEPSDGIILVNGYEHDEEFESYQRAVETKKDQRTVKPRK
ncbi:hypothetical protein Dimus_028440 [Dionaea muscipula]